MASYPPEQHVLRDLQPQSEWISADECVFSAPVPPEVRTAKGAMALGPLLAIADLALVGTAIGFAESDWCGTLDLAIRTRQPITEGPCVIACEVLRVGGTLITTKAEIRDGDRFAGTAIATSRRMPRNTEFNSAVANGDLSQDDLAGEEPESPMPIGNEIGVVHKWGLADSGFRTHFGDQLGLVEVAPGTIELAKTPYVTNSFGTINGGATGILLCAGAESALGGEYQATDVEVRYTGQAGDGPVRTMAEIVRAEADHAVVDVVALDMSRERRVIAAAGVTLTGLN